MQYNEAVVNPQKTADSPQIGPVAVMVATRPDLDQLCELLNFRKDGFQRLFLSRLYIDRQNADGCSVVGPFIGAPYAVMLFENLIAWGARRIIFIGWCGAISSEVKIGDVILPTAAYIDEGTSRHYRAGDSCKLRAAFPLVSIIRQALNAGNHVFNEGTVWTTDAVYRETRAKVIRHQQHDILAVDMEMSALFAVAQFRGVDLSGILVVSDELSTLNWRPGFKQERFRNSRKAVCRLVAELVGGSGPDAL